MHGFHQLQHMASISFSRMLYNVSVLQILKDHSSMPVPLPSILTSDLHMYVYYPEALHPLIPER